MGTFLFRLLKLWIEVILHSIPRAFWTAQVPEKLQMPEAARINEPVKCLEGI